MKRPTADDEAVYTDYGSAGLKEYFSPPKESTVPTERTNSVVSSSAAIFGEYSFCESYFKYFFSFDLYCPGIRNE